MKLKSTLWALAFACAAVSCSDDLDEGPNNGQGENNGSKTFMTVTINPGVVTKADPNQPQGGEEGNDDEVGEEKEYNVKNVTVILFKNGTGDEAPSEFRHDSKLVAAGFAPTPTTSTGTENWHGRKTTVEITITDATEDFDGKTYGIIAVTNLGSEETLKKRIKPDDIDTGAELANFLQEDAWSGTGGSETNFVMSTHNDQYESKDKIFDKVTLRANATSENAPQADVHVERLAAKARIAAYDGIEDFIYTIEEGAESNKTTVAKIRLDQVQLVNKLNSGSYLLKRVSDNTNSEDGDIPAKKNGHDFYLGNEEWESGKYNYVIDPWTRGKSSEKAGSYESIKGVSSEDLASSKTLDYDNPYSGETTFNELWESIKKGAISLAASTTEITITEKAHLGYLRENTTSAKNSLNGYSTGALFKATYFPRQYMATTKVDGKDVVKPVDVDYNGDTSDTGFDAINKNTTTNIDFYVRNGNVYKDHEAIFNEFAWNAQASLDGQADATIYSYSDFNSSNITQISIKELMNSVLMRDAAADPFGYLEYLYDKYEDNPTSTEKLSADDAFEKKVTEGTNVEGIEAKLAEIIKYDNCVCYYPYWIRHANNNKPTEMGVMEFGIVRNNIYDLSVAQITKLGLSGAEKPDPEKPDESNELRFIVNINVKNWIVRSNGGIIL